MTHENPYSDDDLVLKLTDAIDENGSLSEDSRKKLMLLAMRSIHNNVSSIAKCLPDMKDDIKTLKDKSILIQIQKHPKVTMTLVVASLVFVFILFTIWTELGISKALTSIIGL